MSTSYSWGQRQVWFIPIADELEGVQVKLWNPLRTRVIPERFWGDDSVRWGAISSACTFTFTVLHSTAGRLGLAVGFLTCDQQVVTYWSQVKDPTAPPPCHLTEEKHVIPHNHMSVHWRPVVVVQSFGLALENSIEMSIYGLTDADLNIHFRLKGPEKKWKCLYTW